MNAIFLRKMLFASHGHTFRMAWCKTWTNYLIQYNYCTLFYYTHYTSIELIRHALGIPAPDAKSHPKVAQ